VGIAALASLIVLVLFPTGTAPTSEESQEPIPAISNIIDIPITINQDQSVTQDPAQPTPDREVIVVTSSSTEPTKQAPIPPKSEDIVIDYTSGDRKINALPKQCILDTSQPFLLINCENNITLLITEYVVPDPPSIPREDLIAQIIQLKQYNAELWKQVAQQDIMINDQDIMIKVLLEALRGIQIIIQDTLALFE